MSTILTVPTTKEIKSQLQRCSRRGTMVEKEEGEERGQSPLLQTLNVIVITKFCIRHFENPQRNSHAALF